MVSDDKEDVVDKDEKKKVSVVNAKNFVFASYLGPAT